MEPPRVVLSVSSNDSNLQLARDYLAADEVIPEWNALFDCFDVCKTGYLNFWVSW